MTNVHTAPVNPATISDDVLTVRGLARAVTEIELSDVPEQVVRQASLCVLDTVACVIAGAAAPEARAVLAAESELLPPGRSPVLTTRTRTAPEIAARLHGYWGDVFELNDLIGGHASIGVVPSALATAGHRDLSGARLVEATVVGIETASRIYHAIYDSLRPYDDVGMVVPGLVNVFGAAAAVARLHDLDETGTANAMAIAGALAGWCPAEVIFGDGGTVKPFLFGAAPAEVGVRAARYAVHGLTGPPHLLDSRLGLGATLSSAGPSLHPGDDGWFLARPRRKLHACCGYLHAAVDGMAALRAELGAEALAGAAVEVRMPPYIVPAIGKAGPPRSSNDARFHAAYCIALAARGAEVIRPEHSAELDRYLPDVADLMERISVVADPALTHYHQCELVVRGESGAPVVRRVAGPRGSPQAPLTDDEVRAKARGLLTGPLSADTVDAYVARFDNLSHESSIDWITDSFAAA